MQSFSTALFLKNGHIQTIYPFIFRKKKTISYTQRIRISTPDNDFLDIDFVESQSDSLVLVLNGFHFQKIQNGFTIKLVLWLMKLTKKCTILI